MKLKIGVLFLFIFLSGCSLLGGNQWAPYQVIVKIQDEFGNAVAGAKLESSEVKTITVDERGAAVMQFRSAGLHVVTITALNKLTKQIKIALPQDENKVFSASLTRKP